MDSTNIEKEIEELRNKLKVYDDNQNLKIHSFITDPKYQKKFDDYNLKYSIDKRLVIPPILLTKEGREKKEKEEKDKKEKEDKNTDKNKKEEVKPEPEVKEEVFKNFHWAGEGNAYSNRIVACTTQGNAFIYNTDNGSLIFKQSFGTGILNTCAIEQTENQMFAVGGFDGAINLKTIVNVTENQDSASGVKKFTGHQGGIAAIRFMNTNYMISASSDSVLLLWDLNTQGKILNSYRDHTSEVSGLDVNEVNGNIFATGSGDTTVKIWDIREKKPCVATFEGSDSSINCVRFLPGKLSTLVAGSEDSSIRLYDLRTINELGVYKQKEQATNPVNSVGFSKSGRILFGSTTDSSSIAFWDIFGDGTPFASHDYVNRSEDNSKKENEQDSDKKENVNNKEKSKDKGIIGTSINAAGNKIAFIDKNNIVIIK